MFFEGCASGFESKRTSSSSFSPKYFQIKLGVLPSEALKQARKGPSLLDCLVVAQIAQYRGILHAIGEENFNRKFSATGTSPLILGAIALNPIYKYLDKFAPLSEEKLQSGDLVYFENAADYSVRNPLGAWQGINTLFSKVFPGKYCAFGFEGTKTEVEDHLWERYQQIESSYHFEHLPRKIVELKELVFRNTPVPSVSRRNFNEKKGGKVRCVYRLNQEKIQGKQNSED